MPIVKIPVVHRFGIGSQGQQLELQKRIFKKAQEIEDVNKEKDAVHRYKEFTTTFCINILCIRSITCVTLDGSLFKEYPTCL